MRDRGSIPSSNGGVYIRYGDATLTFSSSVMCSASDADAVSDASAARGALALGLLFTALEGGACSCSLTGVSDASGADIGAPCSATITFGISVTVKMDTA